METSVKQDSIIAKIKKLNPGLEVTSTTRPTKNEGSGHSAKKQTAVDFKGSLQELFQMFELIPNIYPTWTVGLGILNAQKHLHISDDGRGFRFLEIERPDKNGFVKIIPFGSKNYYHYHEIAQNEYEIYSKEKKN